MPTSEQPGQLSTGLAGLLAGWPVRSCAAAAATGDLLVCKARQGGVANFSNAEGVRGKV